MQKIIRGTIFYALLNPVVGSEQGGYRPVLVIQNDIGNKYSGTTIIAPITTKYYKGKNMKTHVTVKQFENLRYNSIVLLEQIRVIDKSRLKGYVCTLSKDEMEEVDKAIINALGLNTMAF